MIIIYLVKDPPEGLKELFKFILKKEEKKDYLLLKAYKPITLKNTLVKLAEKILTIYIIEKAWIKILLL